MKAGYVLILWLGMHAFGMCGTIKNTELIADQRMPESKNSELLKYLQRFIGQENNQENARSAEDFLSRLFYISKASCDIKNYIISCSVSPKFLVKSVKIRNLPAAMLETELVRKLPVQRGQLINFDEKIGLELLKTVRTRVKTYLRKVGFYGASVDVAFTELNEDCALDFEVTIKGGGFARVNKVVVEGRSPIKLRAIQRQFEGLCRSFYRLWDALSMWSFSCYSRELEREATDDLQERLAALGYVRARIGVQHQWLNPHDPKTPRSCQNSDPLDHEPRCVDLRIEIDQGPKVRWSINMMEGKSISRNAVTRFVGSLLISEYLSRATLFDDSEDIPADQLIIKQELEKQINFVNAKNIDEQELRISAERMTSYLVSRGFVNAEVVPSYFQEDIDNILVNFDVYTGKNFHIAQVEIQPESMSQLIKKSDLAEIIKTRSFSSSGNLSYAEIETAKAELLQRFNDKGFSGLSCNVEMISLIQGGVLVIFHFVAEPRQLISEIIIENGISELNKQVIPTLKNCDNFKKNNIYPCQDSSLVLNSIASDEAKIAEFYQANNFVYARVRSKLIAQNKKNKLIFFIYDSRYGQDSQKLLDKQSVKELIISGNFSTNEKVIRRLFPFAKNSKDSFDALALRKGLANLRESGRFSRIDSKLMAGQENSNDLYFALHVSERPSLSIDTSIGFSTDQLFMLEAELEENNLFSSMMTLKTKLSLGLFWGRQSSINNKFIWPFIGGKPFNFTLHAPIIVYDDKMHRPDSFTRLQSKVIAQLEWRASTHWSPYLRYFLTHTQIRKFTEKPEALSLSERFKSLDGLIPTMRMPGKMSGVIKPGISFINLDNPFDPRSGVDLNNWVEINAGPFVGLTPFVNIGTQNRFYLPLGPLTLALQASFMRAFIKPNANNFSELQNTSSMDKLGGDRSVRGYQEATIGIDSSGDFTKDSNGYFYNVANLELRFPLSEAGRLGNFSGALFVDQGLLIPCSGFGLCGSDLSFQQIITRRGFGLSLGAGIRYLLPVGPISLDYGISPIHNEGRVHLQLGYAF